MGRRSTHTPEELRQLILEASRQLVETDGLAGYSAREIARKIGYSAGTLYNIFEDLDDVLLTLQVQLINDVSARLKAIPHLGDSRQRLQQLSRAYVDFALSNKKLWNLLFTHQPGIERKVPDALHAGINGLIGIVSEDLSPHMPGASAADIDSAARTLWAGIHGITAIAVTDKSPTMTTQTAHDYVERLTNTYLRGVEAH